jgi:hypothetical protein
MKTIEKIIVYGGLLAALVMSLLVGFKVLPLVFGQGSVCEDLKRIMGQYVDCAAIQKRIWWTSINKSSA